MTNPRNINTQKDVLIDTTGAVLGIRDTTLLKDVTNPETIINVLDAAGTKIVGTVEGTFVAGRDTILWIKQEGGKQLAVAGDRIIEASRATTEKFGDYAKQGAGRDHRQLHGH